MYFKTTSIHSQQESADPPVPPVVKKMLESESSFAFSQSIKNAFSQAPPFFCPSQHNRSLPSCRL